MQTNKETYRQTKLTKQAKHTNEANKANNGSTLLKCFLFLHSKCFSQSSLRWKCFSKSSSLLWKCLRRNSESSEYILPALNIQKCTSKEGFLKGLPYSLYIDGCDHFNGTGSKCYQKSHWKQTSAMLYHTTMLIMNTRLKSDQRCSLLTKKISASRSRDPGETSRPWVRKNMRLGFLGLKGLDVPQLIRGVHVIFWTFKFLKELYLRISFEFWKLL